MKKKNMFYISMAIFLVIGIIIMIVGFYLSGANILEWFTSQYAMWCYIAFGVWFIVLIGFIIKDKIWKM